MKNVNIAVLGATGAVGRIMCRLLEERELPVKTYRFLASKRSAGSQFTWKGKTYTVEELTGLTVHEVTICVDDMKA